MKPVSRRRPAWAICLLALVCICATAALPGAVAERGPLYRAVPSTPAETEARVIVKYKAESTLMRALSVSANAVLPQHAQALSARLGLSLTDGRAIGASAQVLKGQGLSSQALADRLAAQSDVEYAVVDGRMQALAAPNDLLYGVQTTVTPAVGQWYLRAPTSNTIVNPTSVLASIDAEAAWAITTGSRNVVVAVLDTGVRKDHPDLQAKLLDGYDFVDASLSNDGAGRHADASDPGDYTGTGTSSWHGTQTAGLIGASTNNGIGMASVGRDVMLLPVRVLGTGGGFDSDIQAAMLWAGGIATTPTLNPNPAKVINLSLGAKGSCNAQYQDVMNQLTAKGVVVVAAAGNDGLAVGTPANCIGVIAVAGIRHAGTKVGYSDLGPEIALAAPAGNCVNTTGPCLYPLLTTSNSGTTKPVADSAGGSIYTDGAGDPSLGTSFSAPLVSGTVGLMFSANPSLTPAQVLSALKSTARTFPAAGAGVGVSACTAPTATAQGSECYCTITTCGAGMLDAGKAVAAVATTFANIAVASTAATAGSAVVFDGSASRSSFDATISSYLWEVSSGAASFTSATNAATATLLPSAAGTVVVKLTVTDSKGRVVSSSVTLAVAAVVVPPAAKATSSGGGGAVSWGWLLGCLAAVAGVRAVTPRRGTR